MHYVVSYVDEQLEIAINCPLVAEVGGKAIFNLLEDKAELYYIRVHPLVRRNGLALSLLKAAEEEDLCVTFPGPDMLSASGSKLKLAWEGKRHENSKS